jgi:hypothetical protein
MSKIYILKSYLKEQAALIRATKKELKEHQRTHKGCSDGYFSKLKKLSQDYRHHHIAYSMLKGKAYEVIESPKTKCAPDFQIIKGIKDAHTENVCISAS